MQKIVTLEGEVMFPGKYALTQEKEILYHLLQRAGGLTPKAFPKGVIFVRSGIIQDVERRNIQDVVTNTQLLEKDTLGNVIPPSVTPFNPGKLNRVVIDLPKILKGKGGESDIVLQDGDSIFVPQIPSEVQVVGSVGSSSSIKFVEGKKVKYYIDRAGGYTRNSDKNQTRLIKANGRVISGGSLRGRKVELVSLRDRFTGKIGLQRNSKNFVYCAKEAQAKIQPRFDFSRYNFCNNQRGRLKRLGLPSLLFGKPTFHFEGAYG